MFLTICTPTYNRGYTLPRVLESLKSQTCKDFEWIIVDDGSDDDTKELINLWINNEDVDIKYYYQENSGKHIALNQGMRVAKGKVFTCLDSDDWFKNTAVETVKKNWKKVEDNAHIAGIMTLDCYENEEIIGTMFPEKLSDANWIDLQFKYKMRGDKAYFIKTDILMQYEFPNFKGNKHMPPSFQYFMLSKKYNFLLLNEPIKYVEYMPDGISRNKYRKYVIAPDNFAYYRMAIMDLIPTFKRKIINTIHFNSSIYIGETVFRPEKIKNKILITLTKPIGYILSKYIRCKNK